MSDIIISVTPGGGGGGISGPSTSISGDLVMFAGVSGNVVVDSGILAASILTSGVVISGGGGGGSWVSGSTVSTSGNLVIYKGTSGQVIVDIGISAANLVSGASSSTSHDVVIFSNADGKSLMDSNVLADPSTGSLTSVSGIYRDKMAGITHIYSGWPNRTDSSVSFNNGTRQLQVTPTGASFTFYIGNVPFTFSTAQNVIIGVGTGLWYIWFDNTGALNASQTAFDFSTPIAMVATIYWNGTTGLLNEERHGMVLDWADHRYLHTTVGTRYVSGLTGTFNANNTFSITAGQVDDEDIEIAISTQTACQVFWRTAGPGNFTFSGSQAGFFQLTGTRVEFDNGGVLTGATNGNFVAYFVFATDNIANPIFVIMGQRQDTSLANAQANALPSSLALDSLPSAEMKLIYVVYIQQVNPTTQAIGATVDYRGSSSLPITNYVPTAHSSLTGLIAPADDHTQYILDGGATSVSGNIGMYVDTSGRTINDSGILAATLVSGPASATSGAFVIFNGTGGKILADSGILPSVLVSGPATSTSGHLVIFNGSGGIVIADSGIAVGSVLTSGGGGGGSSFWTALTATTDFATTAPSTNTITMNTDQTANIKIGAPIRYTFNSGVYYGQVTALTASLLTFRGPAITTGAGLLTALAWGDPSRITELTLTIPGYFEEATVTSAPFALETYLFMRYGFPWKLPGAYCVGFSVINRVADTGTTPIVNTLLGAPGSMVAVSTSNSNAGISLPGNNTSMAETVVDINPSNYAISRGQYIELEITKGTDTVKATDLTWVGVFVFP